MAEPVEESLKELSKIVADNAGLIQDFLSDTMNIRLSDGVDGPSRWPVEAQHVEIHQARRKAMTAAKKIHDLLWGAEERLLYQQAPHIDIPHLQAMSRFNILQAIPLHGSASYEEIASQTGLDAVHLRRLLRSAMAAGFLDETVDGRVRHNASSAVCIRKPLTNDILGIMSDFCFEASTGVSEAMRRDPGLREPNAAGFNVAFKTDLPFLSYLDSKPEAAQRFRGMMKAMADSPGHDHRYIIQGFNWAELGKATVVDIGGSSGLTCMTLAKEFPQLDFVVEDLESTIAGAHEAIADQALQERIRFVVHDFFTPQPRILGARVYILRWIIHDWPTSKCVEIIRNLIPGMEPGSRVLIAEIILAPRGTLSWPEERFIAGADLVMMMLHNSQERTLKQFQEIMREADPKFRYVDSVKPENSILTFMEFAFDD